MNSKVLFLMAILACVLLTTTEGKFFHKFFGHHGHGLHHGYKFPHGYGFYGYGHHKLGLGHLLGLKLHKKGLFHGGYPYAYPYPYYG